MKLDKSCKRLVFRGLIVLISCENTVNTSTTGDE
jgi:hypothetical protein